MRAWFGILLLGLVVCVNGFLINDVKMFNITEYIMDFNGVSESKAPPPPGVLTVDLTLIHGVDSKGAVCLDGKLPGYHFSPGFGSGANSWLIQLELDVEGDRNALTLKRAIFCDGSWSCSSKSAGLAAIRLGPDSVEHCHANFLIFCNSSMDAEIAAIALGMELAVSLGLEEVVICSDCIDALWSFFSGFAPGVSNYEDLKKGSRLLDLHPSWRLAHVLREDNTLADMVAKKARVESWTWISKDSLPRLNWMPSDYH